MTMRVCVSIFLLFFCATLFARESLQLTNRQLCDLEMILNEGFSPLTGFMDEENYHSVVENMRLADGSVWPMPIVLDVNEDQVKKIQVGDEIELKDGNDLLATLNVASIWRPDKMKEGECVYGTTSLFHDGVAYLMQEAKDWYVGGRVHKIALPKHGDFQDLRRSPQEMKKHFKDQGIEKIVAFQTRNPMHRAHYELTLRAIKQVGAHLLIHPVVGMTKPGDIDYRTRVKCYQAVLPNYPEGSCTLSLLPIAMRMAGPREALWHALIRKNYGATHFIVGRDHAGPGNDEFGNSFYGLYDAQKLVAKYSEEIGIEVVPFNAIVYVANKERYCLIEEVQEEDTVFSISGTELRKRLREGHEVPQWFSYPTVIDILRATCKSPN